MGANGSLYASVTLCVCCQSCVPMGQAHALVPSELAGAVWPDQVDLCSHLSDRRNS